MSTIQAMMRTSPVIPVLVIEDAATAAPLAEALVKGGLRVLEVTMRTPAALDAIREMKQVPGAIVGAGTVVNTEQFDQVMRAGAGFHRLSGAHRDAGQADRRQRRALPARNRHRGRHHARARPGARAFQVLPGRDLGRAEGAQGAGRALLSGEVLPHRRDHAGERARMAGVRSGAVRRGSWVVPKGADMEQVETLAREAASLGG